MEKLKERILKEGKVLDGDILKVDSFINHQVDVSLLKEIALEFYNLYKDEEINKILTIEASGIAIASFTASLFNDCTIVFAKKNYASNMSNNIYSENLYSYTRQSICTATVSKDYLSKDDKVLIIDDFLANGQALNALISICRQAEAKLVGCGVVIEKAYQPGGKTIRESGIRVESLAKIASMEEGKIIFE